MYKFTQTFFVNLNRKTKQLIVFFLDFFILLLSPFLAYSLRFSEFVLPPQNVIGFFLSMPVIGLAVFYFFDFYRNIIRFIAINSLWSIIKGVSVTTMILVFFILVIEPSNLPRSILIINWLLLVIFISSSRLLAKWFFSNVLDGYIASQKKNIIIFGAGNAGVQLVTLCHSYDEYRVKGFIDDNLNLKNKKIFGIAVYSRYEINFLIKKYDISEIHLAIPSLPPKQRKKILIYLSEFKVVIKTLPSFKDYLTGNLKIENLQIVSVQDLLGRSSVNPKTDLLEKNTKNRSILITGAGGSIGSEMSRQLFVLKPSRLIFLDLSEFALYKVEQEFSDLHKDIEVISILGSVLDYKLLIDICKEYNVETIYHAAAYKHVPLIEKNNFSGIQNNVLGTYLCCKAAISQKVENFVLISTDKAIRPTNVMGATKRLSELVLQSLSMERNIKTEFKIVRFGNVLGSSGSVIPLFTKQIQQGGPITVTDPNVVRYFMTIPEAAQLVIQAGAMENSGAIMILDMGEPILISELAKKMIHLSGLTLKNKSNPSGDIEVIYTGLRPGEKLYEELHYSDYLEETSHPLIRKVNENLTTKLNLEKEIKVLEEIISKRDFEGLYSFLDKWVEGFNPYQGINDYMFNSK